MRKGNFNLFSHYTYFVPGVAEIFILLLLLGLGSLIGSAVAVVLKYLVPALAGSTEVQMLVSYPVMFIPPMIYAGVVSGRRSFNKEGLMLDGANLGKVGPFLSVLLVTVGTVALSFFGEWVGSFLPPMPEFLKTVLESLTKGSLWVCLLSVSIFAPFFEEWLCRGCVLRGLLGNGVKPVWAIPISAIFFAVIHLNPWQAIPAFLLGCLFGYVYYKTGSLKLTMFMHFVNNTTAVILTRLPGLDNAETFRDVIPADTYPMLVLLSVVVVFLVVYRFSKIEISGANCSCEPRKPLFEE